MRRYGTKLFPDDIKQEHFDQDEDAFGTIVEVIENANADNCDFWEFPNVSYSN